MVKSNNPQITISAAMLNCLKQALFSQTNGVDLSPIVEDLGGDDKTAIAVALAYKGIKPEVDDAPRFDFCGSYYYQYEFVSYSIIRDVVIAVPTHISFNAETQQWEKKRKDYDATFSLSHWFDMPTSEKDAKDRVIARLNNK